MWPPLYLVVFLLVDKQPGLAWVGEGVAGPNPGAAPLLLAYIIERHKQPLPVCVSGGPVCVWREVGGGSEGIEVAGKYFAGISP